MAQASVTLNGKSHAVTQGATIQTLLVSLGIDPAHVVVEVNTVIVKKESFETHAIKNGDKLEIIRFVGGG